jgi:hypothetical protein
MTKRNNQPTVEAITLSNVTIPRKVEHPIAQAITHYVNNLRGIGLTARTALLHLAKWRLSEFERVEKGIAKFVPDFPKIKGKTEVKLGAARDFARLTNSLREYGDVVDNNATSVVARSLFMQMFSEFDAYIGYLLKAIYLKNDDLLKGISREISLCDLLEFENLDAVKRAMLDKEIDSFRRDSYVEQFATLEKKFGLTLKKFSEWGEFVELSQRRNIFTHNGGVVNDQYLNVCNKEGYAFSNKPAIGDHLSVDYAYFSRALLLLSKVGFMLGCTLWAKVFPREHEQFHKSVNDILYSNLQNERWRFIGLLSDFVFTEPMKRSISEIDLRIRIVNVTIGLMFAKRKDEARALIRTLDWSASYRDFKLAIAVLDEDYDAAVQLMRSIGKSGELIDQMAYHVWPLFTKFRERSEFYDTYQQIYGESFAEQVKTEIDSAAAIANVATRSKRSPMTEVATVDGESEIVPGPINVTDCETDSVAAPVPTRKKRSLKQRRKSKTNDELKK